MSAVPEVACRRGWAGRGTGSSARPSCRARSPRRRSHPGRRAGDGSAALTRSPAWTSARGRRRAARRNSVYSAGIRRGRRAAAPGRRPPDRAAARDGADDADRSRSWPNAPTGGHDDRPVPRDPAWPTPPRGSRGAVAGSPPRSRSHKRARADWRRPRASGGGVCLELGGDAPRSSRRSRARPASACSSAEHPGRRSRCRSADAQDHAERRRGARLRIAMCRPRIARSSRDPHAGTGCLNTSSRRSPVSRRM